MKRVIYGVGFFLVMLFLCTGFLLSYQITQLRDRMYDLEESSKEAEKQVSAMAEARNQDLIFERYEDGVLKKECYRIMAYGADRVVLRQETDEKEEAASRENTGFVLKVENGYVVVYKKDGQEVFEHTNIPLESLPAELQSQVLLGKAVDSTDDLYSFLENYSS